MKLFYQHMAIFLNIPPISSRLHLLQVENRDSNSRLVVDENNNGNVGLKALNYIIHIFTHFELLLLRVF